MKSPPTRWAPARVNELGVAHRQKWQKVRPISREVHRGGGEGETDTSRSDAQTDIRRSAWADTQALSSSWLSTRSSVNAQTDMSRSGRRTHRRRAIAGSAAVHWRAESCTYKLTVPPAEHTAKHMKSKRRPCPAHRMHCKPKACISVHWRADSCTYEPTVPPAEHNARHMKSKRRPRPAHRMHCKPKACVAVPWNRQLHIQADGASS
jgi:hypothetical protein